MKNHCESFEFAVTTDGLFMTASEGLIAMEKIDFVEDYPLLEYTAPSEGQALHAMDARQSKSYILEGIDGFRIVQEEDYSLLESTAPL